MLFRLRRSPAVWLALAAMALNAAWPLMANARPAGPASEICSATGVRHAAGGAPSAPDKNFHASHCNLCPFGAERSAAISATVGPLPVPAPAPARAFVRGDAPQVGFNLHSAAPPRAPPVLS